MSRILKSLVVLAPLSISSLLLLLTGCPVAPLGGEFLERVDPPGEMFDGTGAVITLSDARSRVLAQALGASGYDAAMLTGPVMGVGDSPLDDIYEIPGGPLPAGTRVSDRYEEYEPFTLGESYYLYWIDPAPLVELGHESFIAYVRASDGRVTKQTVEFPPRIGDAEPLFFNGDRDANRIYRHEVTDLMFVDLTYETISAVLSSAALKGTVAQQQQVPGFGGLFVGGTDEWYRPTSQSAMNDMYAGMTGDSTATMDSIFDAADDRLNKDKLGQALRDASAGLGADGKFVFVLSTHGSKGGNVRIGEEVISWEDLCELIVDNVTAKNICVFLGPCYSGLGLATFEAWDSETTAGMIVFASSDAVLPALTLFPTICAAKELLDVFTADDNTAEQSPEAIKAAMEQLDITPEVLKKKVCDFLEEAAAAKGAETITAAFTPFKKTAETVGGSQVGGFPPDDPTPPSDSPLLSPFFAPVFGTGTTNDGGGVFDLGGGELKSDDDGDSVDLTASMQITNQVGHDSGSFNLHGTFQSKQDNVYTFGASGTMMVFTGAQLEDLAGTLTVTFEPGSVVVEFVGTHTENQQATFNLAGDR